MYVDESDDEIEFDEDDEDENFDPYMKDLEEYELEMDGLSLSSSQVTYIYVDAYSSYIQYITIDCACWVHILLAAIVHYSWMVVLVYFLM